MQQWPLKPHTMQLQYIHIHISYSKTAMSAIPIHPTSPALDNTKAKWVKHLSTKPLIDTSPPT